MFGMNLALIANNIGVMWVAIELATLTTVLMVGIYRTHEALEAAWKYFILGSVGIALALFGTILVYMAALPVVGEGLDAMVWTVLLEHAATSSPRSSTSPSSSCSSATARRSASPRSMRGCPMPTPKAPRPYRRPFPAAAQRRALYAVLRFKIPARRPTPKALAPGPLMVTMGLGLSIFAALMLYRRAETSKAMFADSSAVDRAYGDHHLRLRHGGALANFAGLLHMMMHSPHQVRHFLRRRPYGPGQGHAEASPTHPRSYREPSRSWRWGLASACTAIAGLPPLGIFMSEFLVVSSTFARQPLLAILLVRRPADCLRRALPASRWPCLRRADRRHGAGQGLLRADVSPFGPGADRRHLPAAVAGRLVPARREPARLRRAPWPKLDLLIENARLIERDRPWRRAPVRRDAWRRPANCSPPEIRPRAPRPVGGAARSAYGAHGGRGDRRPDLDRPEHRNPAVSVGTCPRSGSSGPCATFGLEPEGLLDERPWPDHGRWGVHHPLGTLIRSVSAPAPHPVLLPSEGEGLHQTPVGPVHAGIIEPGHFRFTANGETVVRLEERLGYVHKGIEGLMGGASLDQAAKLAGAAPRAISRPVAQPPSPFARAAEAASGATAPPRAVYLRALMAELERLANHFGDIGAICNDASFALMLAHCGVLREEVRDASPVLPSAIA